jgi:hypothetical protein
MAELRLYHGRDAQTAPPLSLLDAAIQTASAATPNPSFCAHEVVHHDQVKHWRGDFGSETGGESAIALCDPADKSDVPTADISDATVAQIETELRNRLGGGAGLLAVMRVDETHRIDANGHPRALPVGLDPEAE